MAREEIIDRIETCPYRERRYGPHVCSRFINQNVPCDGACSWVTDYLRQKEKTKE